MRHAPTRSPRWNDAASSDVVCFERSSQRASVASPPWNRRAKVFSVPSIHDRSSSGAWSPLPSANAQRARIASKLSRASLVGACLFHFLTIFRAATTLISAKLSSWPAVQETNPLFQRRPKK